MIDFDSHKLTAGHVANHKPHRNLDEAIAVLDIAQDFLLARLHEVGLFDDMLVFKGGTAIRKLWAGSKGRFSTDLDFGTTAVGRDRDAAAALIAETAVDRPLGPFRFNAHNRRDKWSLTVESEFSSYSPAMRIDIGPAVWLKPETRHPIPLNIHHRYGFAMPALAATRLEETVAEKISRLSRRSTARDAYDLVWIARSPGLIADRPTVRQIAILKMWADARGLGDAHTVNRPGKVFDPEKWLRRRQWDDENIGLLAEPPPDPVELGAELIKLYSWMRDLTSEEEKWAAFREADRQSVVQTVGRLPSAVRSPKDLWGHHLP